MPFVVAVVATMLRFATVVDEERNFGKEDRKGVKRARLIAARATKTAMDLRGKLDAGGWVSVLDDMQK